MSALCAAIMLVTCFPSNLAAEDEYIPPETPAEEVLAETPSETEAPVKEIRIGQTVDASVQTGGEYRVRLRVPSDCTLILETSKGISVQAKVTNEFTSAVKTF